MSFWDIFIPLKSAKQTRWKELGAFTAMVIALAMGLDTLNALTVAATVLVFAGVGLVNFVPKRNGRQQR